MFLIEFVVLTLAYLLLGALVFLAVGKKNDDKTMFEWDNNIPFWFLLAAAMITGVVALFNWGPALLLPNYPTPEQRGWIANTWEFLLKGNNSQSTPTPNTPLPWTLGTWFWWKAAFLYWLLAFLYSFYAFHDEVMEAYRKRIQHIEARNKTGQAATVNPAPHPTVHINEPKGFGARLLVVFVAELFAELVVRFFGHKAGIGAH